MTIPLRVLEFLREPSKIRLPAVDDLLTNKLSSSVVVKIPFGVIAAPALNDPEKIPSVSVVPEVSFHANVKPDGGDPLSAEPILL